MNWRIKNNKDSIVHQVTEYNEGPGWKRRVMAILQDLGLNEDIFEMSLAKMKNKTVDAVKRNMKKYVNIQGSQKSKIKYLHEGIGQWQPGQRQRYTDEQPRNQVSILFKARTRMLDVKNNFRGKYNDLKCRGCEDQPETQEHVLSECKTIHINPETIVTINDIFCENPVNLAETASKIKYAMSKINQPSVTPQKMGASRLAN